MSHSLDFKDHRRELDSFKYVYAVISRRSKGLSIGVNLNTDTACNFSCVYCQVDRSSPRGSKDVNTEVLGQELNTLLTLVKSGDLWEVPPFNTAAPALRRVNDIAVAGDGEPTTCPQLQGALKVIADARKAHDLNEVDLLLLTNATRLQRPDVADALDQWHAVGGKIWAKLDAGSPDRYELVNASATPFRRVIENLQFAVARWRVVIQSMHIAWDGVDPSDEDVATFLETLSDVAQSGPIEAVQVYTIARQTASPRATYLSKQSLDRIAEKVGVLGLKVEVAYGVG